MGFNPLKFATKAIKWAGPAALAPLTGGASLALYGIYGQQSANAQNVALSKEQMEFQERMRDTEVQARVKDLIAAGLNPALAYQQSASSPAGQTAQMENALQGAVSTAIQAQRARAEIDNLKATNENLKADTVIKHETAKGVAMDNLLKATDTSASSLDARERRIRWETEKVRQEAYNLMENTSMTNDQRIQFNKITEYVIREKAAQAQTAELGIAEAQANADLWETVEEWGKGAGLAGNILKGLKLIIFRNKK